MWIITADQISYGHPLNVMCRIGVHQIPGVETPGFRPGRKRRSLIFPKFCSMFAT
jgi:hypothetical protein